MGTQRGVALSLVVLLACMAACSGRTRYQAGPALQIAAGATEAFGSGIEFARPSGVVLDLATPAYVAVARFGAIEVGELVYPLAARDWEEYGYPARGAPEPLLPAGRHRLDIPLPWLRVDVPLAARRATAGDGCRYKHRAWACTSWQAWRVQQNRTGVHFYTELPAPDSLVEHHLVVIVSTRPLDVDKLRARVSDMHDTRVQAAAAANAAPYYLTAQHEGPWASFATTVRIHGVR